MDKIYNDYVLHPKIKRRKNIHVLPSGNIKIDVDENSILHLKALGQTYWSLDVDLNIHKTIDDYFEWFYLNTNTNKAIAIDGMSCTGKSSLISNFTHVKINKYINLQEKNGYNIFPENSISYLLMNMRMAFTSNVLIDRSCISNLAYLYCYYVMNHLGNKRDLLLSSFGLCDEFTRIHNLKPLLEWIKSKNVNAIIYIDSSFEKSAMRMNKRGVHEKSPSDIIKSLVKEYHTAQTTAFAYIANMLNLSCIDFNYLRLMYNVEDDEIFGKNSKMFYDKMMYREEEKLPNIKPYNTPINSNFIKELQKVALNLSSR
ncbi:GMP kinase [Macrobrachium rosenbergii nudivirus]|nr:GMP kinase [Macrobrachium rosenbergii nudivirus]